MMVVVMMDDDDDDDINRGMGSLRIKTCAN